MSDNRFAAAKAAGLLVTDETLSVDVDTFLACPFCPHDEWVSPEDPDCSFSLLLSHIRSRHSGEDLSSAVLWPKIKDAADVR